MSIDDGAGRQQKSPGRARVPPSRYRTSDGLVNCWDPGKATGHKEQSKHTLPGFSGCPAT